MVDLTNKNGRTSKDFCREWRALYNRETGCDYIINWFGDGSIFRKLQASFTNRELLELITFAFSGHSATEYLRQQGFPIRLFPSQINTYQNLVKNPSSQLTNVELDIGIPYWNDTRTTYIWSCIVDSDLDSLISNIIDEAPWFLLLEKMKRQDGYVNEKTALFYKMWKLKETFKRTRVKHETK